ncbi:MAG TPA: tripartite tricarboxylate transporter substrate binding protein [Burkholderiales bacterium]|nr:tripartite tricarboxylate transporter substrate binding protein [Burkholderiales bacterium]
MNRRTLMGLLAALLAGAPPVQAADPVAEFPKNPIRIVVNFPAGGTVDSLARIVGQKLSEKWGQPVTIDNRAGAGGNIGAGMVYTAEPDGYTLLASPPGPLSINQNLYKKLPYDPVKFVPVAMLASIPNVITARADFPANTLKELLAYAKAHPGKVTYGSQGNGSTSHLGGQMLANMGGVELVHVPYKGEGPALIDLVAGRVDLFLGNISAVVKFRQENKVKFLAVAAPVRAQTAPDVPTSAEAGLPGYEASAWFALVAPPGTPAALAQRLHAAVAEALLMPDVRQKIIAQGGEPASGSPADLAAFMVQERARWKKVIDTANVTVD